MKEEHDWSCFICGHDVTEHFDVHRPFGQSGKTCFHGLCRCTNFESMYELCGSKRRRLVSA